MQNPNVNSRLAKKASGLGGFGATLIGEFDVLPPCEEIQSVPLGLAMAKKDEFRHVLERSHVAAMGDNGLLLQVIGGPTTHVALATSSLNDDETERKIPSTSLLAGNSYKVLQKT